MNTDKVMYALGVGLGGAASVFLVLVIGALGLVGAEGDPFDLTYGAVLLVGLIGAVVARLRSRGMARALIVMAFVQALIAVIALIAGKQHSPVSSVFEIVWLNGFFVFLFAGAAALLWRSSQSRSTAPPAH